MEPKKLDDDPNDSNSLPAMEREIEETGLPADAEMFLDVDEPEAEDATDR